MQRRIRAFIINGVKRALIFFLILIPLQALSASDAMLSYDIAAGMKKPYYSQPLFLSLEVNISDVSVYLQTDSDSQLDFTLAWTPDQGKTVHHHIDITGHHIPDESIFTALTYAFAQEFSPSVFRFGYKAGIQAGMAWSEWSEVMTYSLSPMLELSAGLDFSVFYADLLFTSFLKEDRNWKATWSLVMEAGFRPYENMRVYIRSYAQIASVLMDPLIVISGYGVKTGICIAI